MPFANETFSIICKNIRIRCFNILVDAASSSNEMIRAGLLDSIDDLLLLYNYNYYYLLLLLLLDIAVFISSSSNEKMKCTCQK
ncbi:hypothetical protein [Clostridium beijerinckii]|uniref:hypothetical protein n=1 Tax=Clostridium beijerinckii TaxID=1520 RepID=UPI00156D54D0|nr:hypothetical protein [Clostridium beijerinckii]